MTGLWEAMVPLSHSRDYFTDLTESEDIISHFKRLVSVLETVGRAQFLPGSL